MQKNSFAGNEFGKLNISDLRTCSQVRHGDCLRNVVLRRYRASRRRKHKVVTGETPLMRQVIYDSFLTPAKSDVSWNR